MNKSDDEKNFQIGCANDGALPIKWEDTVYSEVEALRKVNETNLTAVYFGNADRWFARKIL